MSRWVWPDAFKAQPLLEDVWGVYLLPAILLTYYGSLAALLPISLVQLGAALTLIPLQNPGRMHAATILMLVQGTATVTALLAEKLRLGRKDLEAQNRRLKEMGCSDGITGLPNRVFRGGGKGNPGLAPVRKDGSIVEILRQDAVAAWLQPIVHLRTGAILGYEALARGPEGTPFFEARELFRAAGAAGRADDLELLCRRRALEAKRNALAPGQKIFVNFDPRLFHCPSGCRTCQLIGDLDLAHDDVVFEVTEHCDPTSDGRVQEGLLRCRGKGFHLALDDLGAAYSGLKALLALKPDYVKLDMSLLDGIDTDPARAGLVRLLVLYARSNGFSLIAEGIETAPVLETLLGLGVEYGQGYLIGRPAPAPRPVSPEAMAVIKEWGDAADEAAVSGGSS